MKQYSIWTDFCQQSQNLWLIRFSRFREKCKYNTMNNKKYINCVQNFKFLSAVLFFTISGLYIAKQLNFIKSNYEHASHHDTGESREYDQVSSSFLLCSNSLFILIALEIGKFVTNSKPIQKLAIKLILKWYKFKLQYFTFKNNLNGISGN